MIRRGQPSPGCRDYLSRQPCDTPPLSRSFVFCFALRLRYSLVKVSLRNRIALARGQPLPQPLVAAPERLALAQRPMAVVASFLTCRATARLTQKSPASARPHQLLFDAFCLLMSSLRPYLTSLSLELENLSLYPPSSLRPTVEMRGLEPLTSALQRRRSPS